MGNKKGIYLVVHAGSILAAAIAKSFDESFVFEPSDSATDVSAKEVYEHLYPGKKVPLAAHLLEEDVVDNPSETDARNLETGIEHYAYDVNDPFQFQSLLNVINNDPREIKRLSDLGATINYSVRDHDNVIDELIEKYQKQDAGEEFEDIDIDAINAASSDDNDDDQDSQESKIDTSNEPDTIPKSPAPDSSENKIDVPVSSIISEPVVNSETNTVNSETQPAADVNQETPTTDGKTSSKK